jgi:hypothetical protein
MIYKAIQFNIIQINYIFKIKFHKINKKIVQIITLYAP